MNQKKNRSFFLIEFLISLILFGFACLDTSKESTFFLFYSFQKTILLLIQLAIVLGFLFLLIFNHTSFIQKSIAFIEKKLHSKLLHQTLLLFTTYSSILLLIIQAFNAQSKIWFIYQKLFYLLLNLLIILIHLLFQSTNQLTHQKIPFPKLFSILNLVVISIYLYLSLYRLQKTLSPISPIIFMLFFLLLLFLQPNQKTHQSKIKMIAFILFVLIYIPQLFLAFSQKTPPTWISLLSRFDFYLTLSFLVLFLTIHVKEYLLTQSIIKTKVFKASFLLFVFLFTSLNFYSNPLQIAHPVFFEEFQRGSDVLIIGKLLNADQDSNPNAFLGVYVPPEILEQDLEFEDVENNEAIFFNQTSIHPLAYKTYTAQLGIQGSFFLTLHHLLSSLTPAQQYAIFELIMVALMSLMLSLLTLWLLGEFGLISALFAFLSINLSPWLLTGARSVYWNFWIFFLPFICLLYFFKWQEKNKQEKNWILYLIIFLTIALKSAMGFEYLSTILIMMSLPWFYYAIKNKVPFKKFITQLLIIILISIASFASSLALLLWKITHHLTHNFKASLVNLQTRITMRTGVGNTTNLSPEFNQNILSTPLKDVLHTYFFNSRPLIFNLHAIHLLIILILLTLTTFILIKKKVMPQKNIAFLLMTFISLLAPLSWLILAKSHSVVHIHINYILFSMPFSILLFAQLGYIIDQLIDIFSKKFSSPTSATPQ